MSRAGLDAYRCRIAAAFAELGIDADAIARRQLQLHREAERLAPVGLGTDGRDKMLTPAAARAWLALRDAALRDGVELLLISGFRGVDYQSALIRQKLARGQPLDAILQVNAPPGYSEHHSGRAVDVGCRGTPPLEEDFDRTGAYRWLVQHASQFGYRMSYPRNNPQGYLYEPWHWCHHGRRR
jgi:D-alanyl-D-alanine carboxypeptidase